MNKLWDLETLNELEKRVKDKDIYKLHEFIIDVVNEMKLEEIR